ncbi:MAG: hypothetical protein ACT4OI_03675 [Methanobacteriota archaeon]
MVAAWPFYLVGTLVILVGFVALNRWMKGIAAARADASGHVLGAAALAFLLGAGTVVAAIAFDSEQIRLESTRVFVYHVAVELNGTDTVRLLLPAPVDNRLRSGFNLVNGTAVLRLTLEGGLALELTTGTDVTFEVRAVLVDDPFNRTLSRFVPSAPPERSGNAAALIDLVSLGGGDAEVRLSLRIEFLEFCFSTRHVLDATVMPGISSYPVASTVATC